MPLSSIILKETPIRLNIDSIEVQQLRTIYILKQYNKIHIDDHQEILNSLITQDAKNIAIGLLTTENDMSRQFIIQCIVPYQ